MVKTLLWNFYLLIFLHCIDCVIAFRSILKRDWQFCRILNILLSVHLSLISIYTRLLRYLVQSWTTDISLELCVVCCFDSVALLHSVTYSTLEHRCEGRETGAHNFFWSKCLYTGLAVWQWLPSNLWWICKAHLTNLRIWAIAQRIWPIGQTRGIWPIAQRLVNCARVWPIACAIGQTRAHLANCSARLPKCAAHLVNPTNSDKTRTKFVKCARIWPIALRICPNALRISSILPTVTKCVRNSSNSRAFGQFADLK